MDDLRLSRTEALATIAVAIVSTVGALTWAFGPVGLLGASVALAVTVLLLPIRG